MKVKDIVSKRDSGVIEVFNEETDLSICVRAIKQNRLNPVLDHDIVCVDYRGGNVYIEIDNFPSLPGNAGRK